MVSYGSIKSFIQVNTTSRCDNGCSVCCTKRVPGSTYTLMPDNIIESIARGVKDRKDTAIVLGSYADFISDPRAKEITNMFRPITTILMSSSPGIVDFMKSGAYATNVVFSILGDIDGDYSYEKVTGRNLSQTLETLKKLCRIIPTTVRVVGRNHRSIIKIIETVMRFDPACVSYTYMRLSPSDHNLEFLQNLKNSLETMYACEKTSQYSTIIHWSDVVRSSCPLEYEKVSILSDLGMPLCCLPNDKVIMYYDPKMSLDDNIKLFYLALMNDLDTIVREICVNSPMCDGIKERIARNGPYSPVFR